MYLLDLNYLLKEGTVCEACTRSQQFFVDLQNNTMVPIYILSALSNICIIRQNNTDREFFVFRKQPNS